MNSNKPVRLTDSIHWVGALNPDLRRFDVVMHTQYGTTYNAYLVQGSEKCALIETVKDKFTQAHLERIRELTQTTSIDYIVLNHTEPDHSGSLPMMLKECPNATVVCSRAAATLLKDIVNDSFPVKVAAHGDSIDLGGVSLSFISAPFLHWPDTMLTYVKEEGVLFPCDVFGCHYSSEAVLESAQDDEYLKAQRYYFDVIMGPFKKYVREALEKLEALDIRIIAPSHGPVLDRDPKATIARYAEWSAPEAALDSVFIGFVACYGYTRALAEELARALKDSGVNAELCDLAEEDIAAAAGRAMRSKAVMIGSPTLNHDVLPPVWALLTSLSPIAMKGKRALAFGSFGWSGEATRMVNERLASIGCKTLEPYRVKMRPNADELKKAYDLGKEFAQGLSNK